MKWRAIIAASLFALSARPQDARLEPIFLIEDKSGRQFLAATQQLAAYRSAPRTIAFLAIAASQWPEGLVPVFRIERGDGQFELRRLPKRGQESSTDPLFFALPREDETNAARIAGKWHCNAANAQRSNHSPDWELAIDGERVAGRFDPNGEYRVAFITDGAFRSNRLELTVEYINDRYFLTGEWRDGKLFGTWRAHDEMDRGKWEATRPGPTPMLPANAIVALYEWRNAAGQKRYSTEEKMPGWSRDAKPICRVWKAK